MNCICCKNTHKASPIASSTIAVAVVGMFVFHFNSMTPSLPEEKCANRLCYFHEDLFLMGYFNLTITVNDESQPMWCISLSLVAVKYSDLFVIFNVLVCARTGSAN